MVVAPFSFPPTQQKFSLFLSRFSVYRSPSENRKDLFVRRRENFPLFFWGVKSFPDLRILSDTVYSLKDLYKIISSFSLFFFFFSVLLFLECQILEETSTFVYICTPGAPLCFLVTRVDYCVPT